MIKFKVIDTSQGNIVLEKNVNEWLTKNPNIEIISTNLVWDEDDLVYTIMYYRSDDEILGRMEKLINE